MKERNAAGLLRARAPVVASAAIFTLAISAATLNAGPTMQTDNPWQRAGAAMFDEEHAHLIDESPLDDIHPLILAAIPKGRAFVRYNAPARCVPGSLRAALNRISKRYGPITVNSTYRSPGKNRRVGGRRLSYHLSCRAVDFRVHGSTRGLMRFLAATPGVGGYNRYPSGFYHIDNGPKRTW
jgi:hypothetical protein